MRAPTGKTPIGAAPLPDPKIVTGPYRPFANDPGWSEAWWWLGIPVLAGIFVIGSYQLDPDWYTRYVIPEGYGVLEVSHFFLPMLGLLIASRLLFLPFVRARPFTWTVTLIAALACVYIADELGPAFFSLEHAGLLDDGEPAGRDQFAQHL